MLRNAGTHRLVEMVASLRFVDDPLPASDEPARPPVSGMAEGFALRPWSCIEQATLHPPWQELAESAVSPNPFFEPWFLLPALERFDPLGTVEIATLVANGKLAALMPVFRSRNYHGRPLPHLAGWSHPNAFCSVPLIRGGYEQAFWGALLHAADRNGGMEVFLHLDQLPERDPVTASLFDHCFASGRSATTAMRSSRAMLMTGPSPQAHLEAALSTKRRKELRRQRRRLEELGEVAFKRVTSPAAVGAWCEEFLALETRGWKGRSGSALACDERTRSLFTESLRAASALGRFEGLSLELAGRPLAMLTNFHTPPGAYSFKTTFDEDYARFSPGVLLQIENLQMLQDPRIAWCDSCAAEDHPMIDRMWPEHREMIAVTVPIGGRLRRTVGRTLTAIERLRTQARQ